MINSIIYFFKIRLYGKYFSFYFKILGLITVSGAWVLCYLRKNLKLDKHLKNMKHLLSIAFSWYSQKFKFLGEKMTFYKQEGNAFINNFQ